MKSIDVYPTAFSDHHSVILKYVVTDASCMILQGRGFWKVNPSLLDDPEISTKFVQLYNSIKLQNCFRENFNVWWNVNFKNKIKNFFKGESFAINEQIRREKSFLYKCLKEISDSMMLGRSCPDEMAYVKSKLIEIENRRLQNYKLKYQPNTIHEEEKIGFYQISSRLNQRNAPNMLKLKIDGIVTSNSTVLKQFLEDHYRQLFEKKDLDQTGIQPILEHVNKSLSPLE